jgi:glycerol uptake facilitator-like aquaporin
MQLFIEIVVGFFLAVGFVVLVRMTGSYSKELLNFAIGLVVAALIYVGFGIYSGFVGWIFTEAMGVPIYAVFAW